MNKLHFTLLLLLWTAGLAAQPMIQWSKIFGGSGDDFGRAVCQTSDGGYFMAGSSRSLDGDVTGYHGQTDCWVIKLDNAGELEWQRSLGGSLYEEPRAVKQTSDGGYILAISTNSTDGDISIGHGLTDYWIVKLKSTGDIEWQKTYGGSSFDEPYDILQTTDGGYLVAGYSISVDGDIANPTHSDPGYRDCWILKLSPSGGLDWQQSFGNLVGSTTARSVCQTSDGGYIVAGQLASMDGDINGNCWVIKLSGTGDAEWERTYGGTGGETATSIVQTSDGGYLMGSETGSYNNGDVSGSHLAYDYWMVKLSATGNIQWQQAVGGDNDDYPRTVRQTADGGFLIGGVTSSSDGNVANNHGASDAWLVKFSQAGDILWQKTFGGSGTEGIRAMEITSDGGIVFAGSSTSNNGDVPFTIGGSDYWIVKLAPETVGLNDLPVAGEVVQVEMTPNPVHNSPVQITLSGSKKYRIEMYDANGRLQKMISDFEGAALTLDSSALDPGVYMIKITSDTGKAQTLKLVVL